MTWVKTSLAATLVLGLAGGEARAQLNGHHLKGDAGVASGTQAPPGTYVSFMFLNYDTDTIRNRDGDKLNTQGSIGVNGIFGVVSWVSKPMIAGGSYSFAVAVPFLTNALDAPVFGLENLESGLGISDLYVQPLNLGWRKPRVDFLVGTGLYLPTGRYEDGADDNTGLGMTSFEVFGGATTYLNAAKSITASALATWETHSKKEDSDTKVGRLMTLEGGLGRSFLKGAASAGLAYYAQWKLSGDEFGRRVPTAIGELSKHRVFALGPDLTLPVATKKKLIALVTVRALWEVTAHSTAQGRTIFVAVGLPVPSVSLQP